MAKEERVCQFYKLSVRKDGDVFPCCLGRQSSRLGNIFDNDIFEKIETKNVDCSCALYKTRDITPDDKINLQKLHIMFSHECQASCVCCHQQKEKMPREEEHLNLLLEVIKRYRPKFITVLGGEVLIQPKTLDWVEYVKNQYPEISFDIITNLCVGEKTIQRAAKIFDDITISILGFSPLTYKEIMGLDFELTMRNFNYLQNNTDIKLRPKYLAMPTNLYELPAFFNWALNQKSEKIYLHSVFELAECCNLNHPFWKKTFSQIESKLKTILIDNKEKIISQNRHYISIRDLLAKLLNINEEYINSQGFRDIIKITS